MKKLTVEEIFNPKSSLLLFRCIGGSHSYNTNIESSDIDERFIYIQPIDDILGMDYIPQVSQDGNDTMGYELRRFLELLQKGAPNAMEMLFMPEHCIVYKHPVFDLILEHKDKFLTKNLHVSMGKFASAQIKKASGQDKKMNWELDRRTRKTVLDFCTVVLSNGGSTKIENYLKNHGNHYGVEMHQDFCGLSKIPNQRDSYTLFYDWSAHIKAGYSALNADHWETFNDEPTKGYHGIVREPEKSNDVTLSSIPKGLSYTAIMNFNKDGYSEHCKDYREYLDFVEKRNPQRMTETITHGQRYDGKNMLHCVRYLMMAKEVASGQGFNLFRSNEDRDKLLNIRAGGVDLYDLIHESKLLVEELEQVFTESKLPESVDMELVNLLLIKIRRNFYGYSL